MESNVNRKPCRELNFMYIYHHLLYATYTFETEVWAFSLDSMLLLDFAPQVGLQESRAQVAVCSYLTADSCLFHCVFFYSGRNRITGPGYEGLHDGCCWHTLVYMRTV